MGNVAGKVPVKLRQAIKILNNMGREDYPCPARYSEGQLQASVIRYGKCKTAHAAHQLWIETSTKYRKGANDTR